MLHGILMCSLLFSPVGANLHAILIVLGLMTLIKFGDNYKYWIPRYEIVPTLNSYFVCKIAKSHYWLRHVCMSVCSFTWNNSAPIGRIFIKFDIYVFFFEDLLRNFKFRQTLTRIMATLHEDQYQSLLHLAHISVEWETFHAKVVEKTENRILYKTHFVLKSCRLWENAEKHCPGGLQTTIWRTRIACGILKATNTHSEYVIFIAFSLQQWSHKHVSVLRYT
jgi:hypothetical protein